jgi:hypothetical protein
MFTKLKVALAVAVVLNAASFAFATNAFAQGYSNWNCRYAPNLQSVDGKGVQITKRLDHPTRWIDNPASPGG